MKMDVNEFQELVDQPGWLHSSGFDLSQSSKVISNDGDWGQSIHETIRGKLWRLSVREGIELRYVTEFTAPRNYYGKAGSLTLGKRYWELHGVELVSEDGKTVTLEITDPVVSLNKDFRVMREDLVMSHA